MNVILLLMLQMICFGCEKCRYVTIIVTKCHSSEMIKNKLAFFDQAHTFFVFGHS